MQFSQRDTRDPFNTKGCIALNHWCPYGQVGWWVARPRSNDVDAPIPAVRGTAVGTTTEFATIT
jgi:hypothetical protein